MDVQVEGLAYDIDFKSRISREAFEKSCQDLKIKFAKPILDAMKNSGLTLVRVVPFSLSFKTVRLTQL